MLANELKIVNDVQTMRESIAHVLIYEYGFTRAAAEGATGLVIHRRRPGGSPVVTLELRGPLTADGYELLVNDKPADFSLRPGTTWAVGNPNPRRVEYILADR